ncbi:MAG: hypothetical protein M5U12_24165 [Verrucomicrobia bacterium]|nr:hypothetical protein [Verrucomicrobiota bacterium]
MTTKRIENLPSVSCRFTARITYPNRIGAFARVVNALGRQGGDLGACDIVMPEGTLMTRDVILRARDVSHQEQIVATLRRPCR